MELLIKSIWDAIKHVPVKDTYAIRIWASWSHNQEEYPLKKGYRHVAEYTFDDLEPGWEEKGDAMFTEDIAGKILEDFEKNSKGCEALLVHCSRGINRAPAVAIALNSVYNLGNDDNELKNNYPKSNWYIHNTIKRVAQRWGKI